MRAARRRRAGGRRPTRAATLTHAATLTWAATCPITRRGSNHRQAALLKATIDELCDEITILYTASTKNASVEKYL
eukprot:1185715-Prorocentrum_minimum.AAC.2